MFPRVRVRVVIFALAAFACLWFVSRSGRWDYNEVRDASHALFKTGIHDIKNMLNQELQTFKSAKKAGPLKVVSESAKSFQAGMPATAGIEYSITIVLGKKKADDVAWLDADFGSGRKVNKAVYVVDDPAAALRPPQNKGNEAMVYLSYIIDHYDKLDDITLFMHHHRWTWHNNDLLDNDSSMVVRHILPQRVIREGYVNLRCQWTPGCPAWLNPTTTHVDPEKEEELLVKLIWPELFPGTKLPSILAQPCCSQFALSKDRILAIPLSEYERIRQWLISTDIADKLSGRLFEYLWQYLWTGAAVLCPSQHACYCDLYGICFEDEAAFQKWFEVRLHIKEAESLILEWEKNEDKRKHFMLNGQVREAEAQQEAMISSQEYGNIRDLLNARWITLGDDREHAFARGKSGKVRASIAEREMDAGDG